MSDSTNDVEELRSIMLRREGGAAVLLRDAVAWLCCHPGAVALEHLSATLQLLRRTRPAMSGFAWLAERLHGAGDPRAALEEVRDEIDQAPARLAGAFGTSTQKHRPLAVATLSHSSTVVQVLTRNRDMLREVRVLRSLPGGEGNEMAEELREEGVAARLVEDSARDEAAAECDVALIGADTVFRDGAILNKVGSRALAESFRNLEKPVLVASGPWTRATISSHAYRPAAEDAGLFEVVPAQLVQNL